MRFRHLSLLLAAALLTAGFSVLGQDAKTPPKPLTLKSKMGNVTFDHASHVKAAKNDCKVCHDKLWPQSATAPIGFKAPHTAAEKAHTSCGFCHHAGGQSFESKGNCNKCHVKGAAKK